MTAEQPAHAKLAPSASSRWMTCPGCINLCEKCPPQKDSDDAIEGTAAHTLAERCLREGINADQFPTKHIQAGGRAIEITEEMVDAVQMYLDEIRGNASLEDLTMKRKIGFVEKRFDLSWVHPDMFGSNDCSIYDPTARHLDVYDLKYGKGIVVEPDWNSQLMVYGLGAIHTIWKKQTEVTRRVFIEGPKLVKDVTLWIVQPRAFHPDGEIRSWIIATEDLLFWAVNVLATAAKATEEKDALLRAGTHCRFCAALAVCPEQVSKALAVAKTDFNNPVLPDPASIGPEDIAKVLHISEIFGSWAKGVKAYAQEQMERGILIPGQKLVARKANRRWIDKEEAGLQLQGLIGDSAYTNTIVSPAQAEKRLKTSKIDKDVIAHLHEKPNAGLTIAPETDVRKAALPSIVTDFAEEEMGFLS